MSGLFSKPRAGQDESNIQPREAIEAQLSRILHSNRFLKLERLREFLSFVVNQYLDGKADGLKETTIAWGVFGKKPDFDPAKYAIVRTTANRLRTELDNYYATDGKNDPILIEIPKGTYIPHFTVRSENNEDTLAADHLEQKPPPAVSPEMVQVVSSARLSSRAVFAVVTLIVSLALGAGSWWSATRQHNIVPPVQRDVFPRRLFARSTSEGQAPIRIDTGKIHEQLLITPDGKKLYALSPWNDRNVTVLGLDDLKVIRAFNLPSPPHAGFMSRNGKHIYISAHTPADGVMVLDTASDRVVEVIPTGTPAFCIVATPDEKKLFLAMGNKGLKLIDLKTHESRLISAQASPFYLGSDPARRRLYVSYQGGGPSGRWGHDSVDIYDTDSEQSIGLIKDLPMVGGRPIVSPGGDLVLFDGLDACSSSAYDHVGCPTVPSHIFHLWQAFSSRVISPISTDVAAFLPKGPRILLLDSHPSVWDWARRRILERISMPGVIFQTVAISPSGGRAFVTLSGVPGLLVFDSEKEECLPPANGLDNLYSGDGMFDDAQGMGSLTSTRFPRFAPGRVGQAFDLNGKDNFLQATGSLGFCTFCDYAWTESLFVKFDSTAGEMTILERVVGVNVRARRLYKAENNHIVYEGDDGPESRLSISSDAPVKSGEWYRLAVVTDMEHVSLYLNGVLQDRPHTIRRPFRGIETLPVFIGATKGKRHFLSGLIDEIAVYNRALSPDELKKIASPCDASK